MKLIRGQTQLTARDRAFLRDSQRLWEEFAASRGYEDRPPEIAPAPRPTGRV